jgi:hypothetical protein
MSIDLLKRAKQLIEQYGSLFDGIPGNEHFDLLRDIGEYLEKPLPEPVAWMKNIGEMEVADVTSSIWTAQEWSCVGIDVVPLYAEPPARKELTIDEIIAAWNARADQYNSWDSLDADEMVNFVLSVVNANAKRT